MGRDTNRRRYWAVIVKTAMPVNQVFLTCFYLLSTTTGRTGPNPARRDEVGERPGYRRPPASLTDSGTARSRAIAATPKMGPTASTPKAHRQPMAWTMGGTSQIETIVIAKPTQVWVVSAVPTYAGGESSVTAVENCAESATMVMPHTTATRSVSPGGPPNVRPMRSAQSPLTAMAAIVEVVRPQRSETIPPSQQPRAPLAMTAKAAAPPLSPP